MMVRSGLVWLVLAASMIAVPAKADVRAGADAWNRGDYATAVREWRQPAENGDADAQFNLGQAYKLGRGVPADARIAEDWYRKAALQGHVQAEDNYGLILFQNGERQKALPYLQKSAGRGEPRAQYLIATALFNGDLLEKDWPRAYALMTRASAAGLAAATNSLAQMDKFMPLEQRQKGLALARTLEELGPVQTAANAAVAKEPPATPAGAAKPAPKRVAAPQPAPRSARATAAGLAIGGWRVQLGALDTQALAEAQWTKLKGRIPALAGLQPGYERAGAFIRLRVGPLESKAAAQNLCAAAVAAGQACFPVAP